MPTGNQIIRPLEYTWSHAPREAWVCDQTARWMYQPAWLENMRGRLALGISLESVAADTAAMCGIDDEYTQRDLDQLQALIEQVYPELSYVYGGEVHNGAQRARAIEAERARLVLDPTRLNAWTTIPPAVMANGQIYPIPPMPDIVNRTPPVEHTERPRRRVRARIFCNEFDAWQIELTRDGERVERPTTSVLKEYMPRELRRLMRTFRVGNASSNREYVRVLQERVLTPAQLGDAFKAWLIASSPRVMDYSSEGYVDATEEAALMRMQPATLIAGGVAFRLQPLDSRDMRPTMRGIRNRAVEAARSEAAALTAGARVDAQLIVRRSEDNASRVRRQLERERAADNLRIPEWLAAGRRYAKFDPVNSRWVVLAECMCLVREFTLYVANLGVKLIWAADANALINLPPRDHTMYVQLALRPDGGYGLREVSYFKYKAPHLSSYCCMTLQGLPERINSTAELSTFEGVLSRGMEEVNLNSLLCTIGSEWQPFIWAQTPLAVRELLPANLSTYERFREMAAIPAELRTWTSVTDMREEAAQTFRIDARP